MSRTDHTPAADSKAADVTDVLTGVPLALYEAILAEPGGSAAALAIAAGTSRSTAGKVLVAMEAEGLIRREPGGSEEGRRVPDRWHTTIVDTPAPQEAVTEADQNPTAQDAGEQETAGDEQLAQDTDRLALPGAAAAPEPGGQETGGPAAETDDGNTVQEQDAPEAGADTEPEALSHTDADAVDGADGGQPLEGGQTPPLPAPAAQVPVGEACPMCGHRRRVPGVLVSSASGGSRLGQGELHQLALDHLREYPEQEWTATGIAKAIGRSSGAIANALATMVTRNEAELTCAAPRRFRAMISPEPTADE